MQDQVKRLRGQESNVCFINFKKNNEEKEVVLRSIASLKSIAPISFSEPHQSS